MRYELGHFEWTGHRVLNGCVLRSGAPWRDLPDNYGPYTTCYNRFARWRWAGIWPCVQTTNADALNRRDFAECGKLKFPQSAHAEAAIQTRNTSIERIQWCVQRLIGYFSVH
jgi:transposase